MNRAFRTIAYAFVTNILIVTHTTVVTAKENKDHATAGTNNTSANMDAVGSATPAEFRWSENRKLTWDDFRGPVNATSEESAAATHCGIGFKTSAGPNGNPQVVVYNTFYTSRSWVRPDADAKVSSVLAHEQGHFDLCEIYTRILRERMNHFSFNVPDVKTALMAVYSQVQQEYESRQEAYEQETIHGTNISVQHKWQGVITKELSTLN